MQSRAFASLLTALALFISVGCSARKPVQIVNKPSSDSLEDWIKAVKSAAAGTGASNTALDSVSGRNLAISYSEAAVLARYTALRERLLTGRATTKVLFDVIELGLTAAVPISNGTRGKSMLGAIATGFKGTNVSIDRNVFAEQSTATILSAMDTCVLRQRKVLAEKRALAADQYTVYNGYSDLTRLFGCTTLSGALQELSENQALAAKVEQQRTLLAPISAVEVNALREIQTAFGNSVSTDKKRALAFLTAMKVEGLSESSSAEEFIAAYRALSTVLGQSTELERFLDAARKAELIK